jgi:hypothetical protein
MPKNTSVKFTSIDLNNNTGSWYSDIISQGSLGLSGNLTFDSPEFTGTPTSPTASTSTNNTQIATTAFVKNSLQSVEGDVSVLKNQTGILFDTFTETFETASYIDYKPASGSSNINHITSGADTFIRANRQYNVDVNTNLQLDESSFLNVQYDAGKLKLASGEVEGSFTSKFYDIQSTTKAIIQPDISNFIDNRQNSSEYSVIPPNGGVPVPSNIVNFSAIEDGEGNVWYAYQDAGTMNLYGWALTSSGDVRMSHRVLFSLSLNSTYNSLYNEFRFYSKMRLEKDRDGNIYIFAPFPNTATNSDMYLIKINKTDLIVTSVLATASNGECGVDLYYDSDKNILHTVISSSDTYLNIFNLK